MNTDRICRYCGGVLDDIVPLGYETVQHPGKRHRTKSHCPSPECDWCIPCQTKRLARFAAAE